MAEQPEEENTILLPAGTILDHYITSNDKSRDYKWYYLAGQVYTNCCMQEYRKIQQYRVKQDLQLENIQLPSLIDRKTKEEITTGTHNVKNIRWHQDKPGINEKNNYAKERGAECKFITYENIGEGISDPLQNLLVVGTYKRKKYIETICYEIVLGNHLVEPIGQEILLPKWFDN